MSSLRRSSAALVALGLVAAALSLLAGRTSPAQAVAIRDDEPSTVT